MTARRMTATSHAWTETIVLTDAMRREAARCLAEGDPAHIEHIAVRCRRCQVLKVYCDKRRPSGNSKVVYYRSGRWVSRMGVCAE